MLTSFVPAVLALALLTVLPGPDVAVVTRVALTGGRAQAWRTAIGIVCGLLVWGLLTVAGLAAVLAASATAYSLVKLAGAVYLIGLGALTLWRSRRQPEHATPAPARSAPRHPWRMGFASNMLNPKIAVFYTSLLPQLVPAHASEPAGLSALVLIHVAITLGWLATYAAIVSRASRVLNRPRVRRGLDRLTGTALVGFGARIATTHAH